MSNAGIGNWTIDIVRDMLQSEVSHYINLLDKCGNIKSKSKNRFGLERYPKSLIEDLEEMVEKSERNILYFMSKLKQYKDFEEKQKEFPKKVDELLEAI